jgi:hypothetical protein
MTHLKTNSRMEHFQFCSSAGLVSSRSDQVSFQDAGGHKHSPIGLAISVPLPVWPSTTKTTSLPLLPARLVLLNTALKVLQYPYHSLQSRHKLDYDVFNSILFIQYTPPVGPCIFLPFDLYPGIDYIPTARSSVVVYTGAVANCVCAGYLERVTRGRLASSRYFACLKLELGRL